MKSKLRQMDRLLRVAELREELARRAVAAARHALSACRRAVAEAEVARDALRREQQDRREVLRRATLGSVQLRGTLGAVLTTFEADREREAEASAQVAAAEDRRAAAEAVLAEAQAGLSRAAVQVEKRRRMRAPLADAVRRRAEMQHEADDAPRGLPPRRGEGAP